MSFRRRLALFLVLTLIDVQVATALFAYGFLRSNLVEQGKRQLAATTAVFMRQLNVLSERVSDDVGVLSLDYALRKAVAEDDQATALSALRNHGNRVGATRMLIVGLDGRITADTTSPDAAGKEFPYLDLTAAAAANDQGTALAVLDGNIYWIVVVPVKAPVPIAFIAACIPVDDALLEKLRQLSSVPHSLALATRTPQGGWSVASRTEGYRPTINLSANTIPAPADTIVAEQQGDRLAMMARLATAEKSAPVVAILDYPLEEALSAYRAVITPMLLVLAGALVVALSGAMLIARGVSRPLELLASAARRIARGDYTPVAAISRRDEIGELAAALSAMMVSIADRESALRKALASVELARNEAVKANDAKSQFLSNMSHEFRTPLNAIIGFSEVLSNEMMGPIAPRYKDYASHIHDSGRHLLLQVEEMLDLSEAADGKLHLSRQRLDMSDILSAALEAIKPLADKAGVALKIPDDMASWPAIDADRAKLTLSLTNVLHNAIKFTPAGGSVALQGEICGGLLRLVITDTGIGIGVEDLALVVRPFHRRRHAFDARHQGFGLGLPFAKTIVELHGGRLAIHSTQGVGTTVTIELPLALDEALNDAA